MSENIKLLQQAIADYNEPQKALTESVIENLKPAFDDLVSDGIEGVRWTQYTPYFNDGDSCEFYVNEPYVKTSFNGEDDGDFEDGFIDSYDIKRLDGISDGVKENIATKIKEITSLISSIPENVMYSVYGDHKQITITAEGTEVEDYDHD
jgi:hypothetical protein